MKKTVSWLLVIIMLLGALFGCAPQQQEITTFSVESEPKSLYPWDNSFVTTITLVGYQWNDQITKQDIALAQGFAHMTVESVERVNDTQLAIEAKGEIDDASFAGTITFASGIILNPYEAEEQLGIEETQESVSISETAPAYTVDISLLNPDAEIAIVYTGGVEAVISVSLKDCVFAKTASESSFSFIDALYAPSVISAVRKDDQTMVLTLNSDGASDIGTLYAQISDATLLIAGDTLSTGKELKTPVGSYAAQIAIAVDYVEETAQGYLMTLLLSCSNGNLAKIGKSQITLNGDLSDIVDINPLDDKTLEIKALVNKEGVDTNSLIVDGNVRIDGKWGETLWGSPCFDANLAVRYAAQESSKELLAIETDLMFDLLKTGLTALASSLGKSAGNRLMEAIDSDLFADETVKKLGEMNKQLQKMDAKWTNILDQINVHLAIMEDKIGSNNCSRVLDEYDTLASTLQATVLHLNGRKASVDAAQAGTPEYEDAKQAYIKAVDKETCKVYTNAYVLGQKILKGTAGLSSGVVGTYDEMLSLLYNFDVQTYTLKEEFRVMTLALYLQAYDHAALYYQLTEPDNPLLRQLEAQLVSISKLVDDM